MQAQTLVLRCRLSLVHAVCPAALVKEVDDLAARVAAGKAEYDSAASELEERRARLKACDRQISALAKAKAELVDKLTGLAVEQKKLGHK